MTLREALQRAHDRETDDEARMLLKELLNQKSDKYGTLVDECEIAIFG